MHEVRGAVGVGAGAAQPPRQLLVEVHRRNHEGEGQQAARPQVVPAARQRLAGAVAVVDEGERADRRTRWRRRCGRGPAGRRRRGAASGRSPRSAAWRRRMASMSADDVDALDVHARRPATAAAGGRCRSRARGSVPSTPSSSRRIGRLLRAAGRRRRSSVVGVGQHPLVGKVGRQAVGHAGEDRVGHDPRSTRRRRSGGRAIRRAGGRATAARRAGGTAPTRLRAAPGGR